MTQPMGGYRQDEELRARIQAFSPDEPGIVFSFGARPARGRGTAAVAFGALLPLGACAGAATPGWVAIGVLVLAVIMATMSRNAQGFQPLQPRARRTLNRGHRAGGWGGGGGGGGVFFDGSDASGGDCGDGGGSDGGGCGGGGE